MSNLTRRTAMLNTLAAVVPALAPASSPLPAPLGVARTVALGGGRFADIETWNPKDLDAFLDATRRQDIDHEYLDAGSLELVVIPLKPMEAVHRLVEQGGLELMDAARAVFAPPMVA